MQYRLVVGLLGASLLLSPIAYASPTTEAEKLFAASDVAYKAGHFDEAASLLERAYALSHAPVLLYNLARAYEGLGALEKSVDAYERYLKDEPNPPDRGAIETRITTLRRQLSERATLESQRDEERMRAEREAHARARTQQQPAPHAPSAVPWVVLGVGAAGLATGGVFGGLALSRHADAMNDPQGLSAFGKQADAFTFASVANVMFIAGGAVSAVGLVWGIIDLLSTKKKREAHAPLRIFIGALSFSVGGELP